MLDLSDYDRKIRDLLGDADTYESLSKDPTPAQERKMNLLLLNIMRSGAILEPLYQQLRSSAGKVPRLYGLPKVHKIGVPLRPIVSFTGSPMYCLSKHLVTILSPLVGKSGSHVKNSAAFSSFIAGQTLSPEMALVSFDVVSLFTKVPTALAVRVTLDRLQDDPFLSQCTTLSPVEVTRLLTFCLDATYLSYQGGCYRQIFGTAMGSPVSVTVANLVMEDVEERAPASCSHRPLFWKRYVDDTLTAPHGITSNSSISTSTPLSPPSSSRLSRRLMAPSHSWTPG